MKSTEKATRTCPLCGAEYHDAPALSRTDNATKVCPDCGTRQSLASIGVADEEIEKIIIIIHRNHSE